MSKSVRTKLLAGVISLGVAIAFPTIVLAQDDDDDRDDAIVVTGSRISPGGGARHPPFPFDRGRGQRRVHAAAGQPDARGPARRARSHPAAARRMRTDVLPRRPRHGREHAAAAAGQLVRRARFRFEHRRREMEGGAAQPDRGGRPLWLDERRADRQGQGGAARGAGADGRGRPLRDRHLRLGHQGPAPGD